MKRNRKKISERRLEKRLANLLARVLKRSGGHVRTFEDRGVLTMNRGLVITLDNRQEFQLTIVESTRR
jgi:uncharacterized membrane-anchored protein